MPWSSSVTTNSQPAWGSAAFCQACPAREEIEVVREAKVPDTVAENTEAANLPRRKLPKLLPSASCCQKYIRVLHHAHPPAAAAHTRATCSFFVRCRGRTTNQYYTSFMTTTQLQSLQRLYTMMARPSTIACLASYNTASFTASGATSTSPPLLRRSRVHRLCARHISKAKVLGSTPSMTSNC